LKSANDRIVAPRVAGTFKLTTGGTTELQVPPTLAGKYSGEVHASAEATGSAITRELTIDPGLATGSLIEHRDGAIRSAGLVAGRLDANGVYSARVQLSRSSGGATRYDEVLALHPAGDGQFEVTFVEAQEDDRAIESQLKRKPFGEDQYRLAGRMRRE
jgi:hypothetical protein